MKDEALDWYMTVRKNHQSMTIEKLRSLFLSRFAVKLVDPMIELRLLKYDPSKRILDYYQNKRRIGTSIGLAENHIISLMIGGLPPHFSSAFNAVRPKTMDHFLEIAS